MNTNPSNPDGTGEKQGSVHSALTQIGRIRRQIRHKKPALFLDYDGTLTPIVSQPDNAVLSAEMRQLIAQLAQLCPVGIISGRERLDVQQLVNLDNIIYAGSHGFDVVGPDNLHLTSRKGDEFLPALDKAGKKLAGLLTDVPKSLIEPKKFSIAVHYRNVPEKYLHRIEPAVDNVISQTKGLRKRCGKKVFELQPDVEWDKGRALLWLLEKLDLNGKEIIPFYIGDDITDEDAFDALKQKGITILVGPEEQPTKAAYRLKNPAEVKIFLTKLILLVKAEKVK